MERLGKDERERMMIGIKVRHSSIMLVRKKERDFFLFIFIKVAYANHACEIHVF